MITPEDTDQQGAELTVGLGIGADDDFMASAALGLRPGLGTARLIGRVGLFRDDAFQRQLARRSENGVATGFEMFDETQAWVLAGIIKQCLQTFLAFGQRQLSQILIALEQQIEGEVDQFVGLAFRQCGLKCCEIRRAVFIERADLPVDDGIRQVCRRCRNRRILGRPVQALTGLQRHLAVFDARLNAVAVELDLVDPAIARGWAFERFAKLRRYELRHRGLCRLFRCWLSLCRRIRGTFLRRQSMIAVPNGIRLNVAALHHERFWLPALAGGDRLHGSAGGDGGCVVFKDSRAILLDREIVVMLDQQPICALAAVAIIAHPHQHEAAMQPLTFQRKLEITLGERLFGRLVAFRLPVAAIPKHDRTAAILAFRYRTFEVAVVQRMVLDLDSQALVVRIERRSFGHRPGLEDAIEFEPQIIMQPRRVVFLNDEAPAVRRLQLRCAARLVRLLKIAFLLVSRELVAGHGSPRYKSASRLE